MNSVTFRPAEDGDYADVEAMVLALYSVDSYGEEMSTEKIRRTFQTLRQNPERGQIFIFCINDSCIGYSVVIYFWSNEYGGDIATIDELFIKPPYRSAGVGSEFIQRLPSLVSPAIVAINLEVTPNNTRAYHYYLRQGFQLDANRHLFRKLSLRKP